MQRLAIILSLLPASSLQAQSDYLDANAKEIEGFLHRHFDDGSAGMAIGLLDQYGTRVFHEGSLDNGTQQTVDATTIFEMGSVTKVFTALLLLDAVRRGEMRLDDPVAKFMPNEVTIPSFRGQAISLHNLAAQDSGLPWHPPQHQALMTSPSDQADLAALKSAANAFTIKMLYEATSAHKLEHAPGSHFQYSNVGMALLGHAIERATGQNYESLVVERICRPLGMTDTRFTLTREQQSRLAHGHLQDGSRARFWNFQAMQPAGGLLTTTADMLKFLAANLGFTESPLTAQMKQSHAVLHTGSKQFGRSAMPWVDDGVYQPPGKNLLGHAGGGAGTIAFVALDTNNRRAVVVLTNQMNVYPNPVGWTLIQGMPFTPANTSYAVREVVGVGIVLGKKTPSDKLEIIKVFPQSPAGKAGIKAGTQITHIDEASVAGKSVKECQELLTGRTDVVRLKLENADGNQHIHTLTKQPFLTNS